jgi:hypothetical protein
MVVVEAAASSSIYFVHLHFGSTREPGRFAVEMIFDKSFMICETRCQVDNPQRGGVMNLIWFLVVLPTIVFFYVASAIVKGKRPALTPYVTPLPTLLSSGLRTTSGTQCNVYRKINLISAREVGAITGRAENFIYIKIGGSGCWEPRPRRGIHVLHIVESELFTELRWIPAQTIIVLCGVSDLSKALIWSGHKISGLAPIYIVTSDLFHAEIA